MRQYNTKKSSLNYHELSLLRNMAVDEVNAIKQYKKHLASSKNEELNSLLKEILCDEQSHFDILLDVIRTYDKIQGETYLKVKTSIKNIDDNSLPYVEKDYDVEQYLLKEIEDELNAVSEYEHILHQIPLPEVQDKILHIINDEKEHIEELTKTLNNIQK